MYRSKQGGMQSNGEQYKHRSVASVALSVNFKHKSYVKTAIFQHITTTVHRYRVHWTAHHDCMLTVLTIKQ